MTEFGDEDTAVGPHVDLPDPGDARGEATIDGLTVYTDEIAGEFHTRVWIQPLEFRQLAPMPGTPIVPFSIEFRPGRVILLPSTPMTWLDGI